MFQAALLKRKTSLARSYAATPFG